MAFGGGIASAIGGNALGTLFVRLAADASRLVKGMTDAENSVAKGAVSMSGQLKAFQKVAAGAFTAAAGSFAFFTKQAIDGADAMNRLSQEAGQTITQFSGLATAAGLADVSAQDLAASSRFLSKWMEKVGIDSKNLTEDIIAQADSFAKMEDGAAKVRMAMEKFGRGGVQMIPFLNQGTAAIRAQIEEARILGAVIGPEFGQNADTFNDNLTRINTAFKGIFNVVAAELLPVWIEMQERFIQWVKDTDAVHVAAGFLLELFDNLTFAAKRFALGVLAVWTTLKTLGTLIGSAIAMAFEMVLNHTNATIQLFKIWFDTIKAVIEGLKRMADVAALAAKAISAAFKGNFLEAAKAAQAIPNALGEGWNQVTAAVKQGAISAGGVVVDALSKDFGIVKSISESAVEEIGGQWVSFLETGEKLLQPVEVRAKAVQNTVNKITQDIEANEKLASAMLAKVGMPTMDGFDPFTSQISGLQKEQDEAAARIQILTDFLNTRKELELETEAEIFEVKKAWAEKQKALQLELWKVTLQSASSAFEQLAGVFKDAQGEQSAAYKTMFAISKAFAIADATIKIAQGTAKALGDWSFPASIGVIASIAAQGATIMASIQSVAGTFGGERALGGPVTAGKSFLVGERGPEMFSPRSAGTIIPNDQMGGGTKVVINNYTDATAQVSERQDGNGKVIEVVLRRVKNDIASEIRDGRGDVNRAMEAGYGLRRGTR